MLRMQMPSSTESIAGNHKGKDKRFRWAATTSNSTCCSRKKIAWEIDQVEYFTKSYNIFLSSRLLLEMQIDHNSEEFIYCKVLKQLIF